MVQSGIAPIALNHPAIPIIISETTARLRDLRVLAADLSNLEQRYGTMTQRVLVPDTNVFMHYTFFTEAPWPALVDDEKVHLAIPLVVVEELDKLKFLPPSRDRARKVIRALDEILGGESAGLVELPGGRGTLEVVPEERGHRRQPAVDAEIIEVCAALSDIVRSASSLVTGDLNMKVRARSLGVSVVSIPDDWLLPSQAG